MNGGTPQATSIRRRLLIFLLPPLTLLMIFGNGTGSSSGDAVRLSDRQPEGHLLADHAAEDAARHHAGQAGRLYDFQPVGLASAVARERQNGPHAR
jgi:hypothetical protein